MHQMMRSMLSGSSNNIFSSIYNALKGRTLSKESHRFAFGVLQGGSADEEELSSEEENEVDSEESDDDEWDPSLATPAAQGRRTRRSSNSRHSSRPSVRLNPKRVAGSLAQKCTELL